MDHPSEETLGLYLGDALNENDRASVDAHVRACHACATVIRDLTEMDRILANLPANRVAPLTARRIRTRLLLAAPAQHGRWRVAAAACLLLALGAVGGAAIASRGESGAIVRDAEGPKFALMFAEEPQSLIDTSSAERQRHYLDFMDWMRTLGDSGVRLGGSQLDDSRGRVVGASTRSATSDLVLSGFLVIRASGYDEAERLARRCPIVTRGGQVIVRQLR
jgi:hypothetical protein